MHQGCHGHWYMTQGREGEVEQRNGMGGKRRVRGAWVVLYYCKKKKEKKRAIDAIDTFFEAPSLLSFPSSRPR